MDFVGDGRHLRTLNVVHRFKRECFGIEWDYSLCLARFTRVLDKLVWAHGLPAVITVDNDSVI